MTTFDLSGRKAIVTGASSGLGVQFAKTLAAAGADVALCARREDRLEALAAEIEASGGRAKAYRMDVTDTRSVDGAVSAITADGGPATIVINNSGLSRENWLTMMDEADWDLVMDTNLKGVWRVAKAAAREMMATETPGSIVNIASITAFRPAHLIGAYATSKAAVRHLTHSMALEWARAGIRVNAIAPGYFQTEINDHFLETDAAEKMKRRIPMKRFGELGELSGALLLLASDAGSYITGETITVDGGHVQASL